MTKIIYLILTILIFISCRDKSDLNENYATTESPTTKKNHEFIDLSDKIQNREKLFLKFWEGMSEAEFDTVAEILVAEKIVSGKRYNSLRYNVENVNINLSPIFKDDHLEAIKLSEAERIYPALAEKYNLPTLLEKNIGGESYIENNPDYIPALSFQNSRKQNIQLPYFFNENTTSYNNGHKVTTDNIENVLPESPLVIRKGNVVIYIDQKITMSKIPITTHSLDNDSQVNLYFAQNDNTLDYFDKEKIISTKSKYRTISYYNEIYLNIWYKSKSKFERDSIKDLENSSESFSKNWKSKDDKMKKAVSKDL
jgi:hypothetical protein